MQKSKYATGILPAVVLCFVLSACGGGGGSNNVPTNTNNTTSNVNATPVVIPAIPNTPALNNIVLYTNSTNYGTYAASNDIRVDSLGWLNNKRQNLGLAALVENAGLDQSSGNHAKYLVDNQLYTPTHDEDPTKADYTGTHFYDRINQVFPNANIEGEVLITWSSSATSSIMPVSNLFDAPWHRVIMLDDYTYAGSGYDTTASTNAYNAMNMDLANYTQVLPKNNLLVYPAPGQANVSPSWFDNETPDPFATQPQYTRTNVGYPVTIQAGFNDTLTISSMTITEVGSGVNISCLLVDSTTSGENPNAGECSPYQPLKNNTAYTVNAIGKLNGVDYNVTWSFGTAMGSTNGILETPETKKVTTQYNLGKSAVYNPNKL